MGIVVFHKAVRTTRHLPGGFITSVLKNSMPLPRFQLLDKVGFIWNIYDHDWDVHFQEFKKFKKKFGHCRVSRVTPEYERLAEWTSFQRTLRNRKRLAPERELKLDKLGFVWNLKEDFWERNLKVLIRYYKSYGHCNVPKGWPKNPNIGNWLSVIRRRKRNLTRGQIAELNKMNIEWDPPAAIWNERFEELRAFRKQYGHARVPIKWGKIVR